jgi:acetyltransferase-like isoleucine patch superfamily enzyme
MVENGMLGRVRSGVARLGARVASQIVARGLQATHLEHDVTVGANVAGYDRVQFGGSNDVGSFSAFGEPVRIGYATTIGWSCVLVGPLTIGDYCQLAPHVLVYGGEHPMHLFSTYTGKRLLNGKLKAFMPRAPVEIGHGVWIGCNAVVLSGARIGNGAVIGAGAVVRDEVPPYAIAVGNPARVVRERIPSHLAQLVESTRWWTLRGDEALVLDELADIDFEADAGRAERVLRKVVELRRAQAT